MTVDDVGDIHAVAMDKTICSSVVGDVGVERIVCSHEKGSSSSEVFYSSPSASDHVELVEQNLSWPEALLEIEHHYPPAPFIEVHIVRVVHAH